MPGILVTDDNEANQQLIGLRLSRAGAEVVTALNGKEALDRVREASRTDRPFDAVIMDMQMPVLDGYEAVRQLRAGGFTDPIVAVTAYAMSEDREECLRLGCDDLRQQARSSGIGSSPSSPGSWMRRGSSRNRSRSRRSRPQRTRIGMTFPVHRCRSWARVSDSRP